MTATDGIQVWEAAAVFHDQNEVCRSIKQNDDLHPGKLT